MSESGDYDPGPWRGHDFGAARAVYDRHVGRSYDDALSSRRDLSSVLETTVRTESTSPLVVVCDVTGSMGDWPATIFSKLPYLEHEAKEYMGPDVEFCFAAVGDAYSDSYPLQVRPFTRGTDLADKLKELIIEGNGGGQTNESYDLAALYFARQCEMPNAIKPVLIFIGDEGLYDSVDKGQASSIVGVSLDKRLATGDLLKELQTLYSVYLVHRPYTNGGTVGRDGRTQEDIRIYDQWAGLLGEDHIAILPEAGRVVDVIFGILAKESDKVDYFRTEIEGRQKPKQIETVYRALETVHLPAAEVKLALAPGHSIIARRTGNTKKGRDLL